MVQASFHIFSCGIALPNSADFPVFLAQADIVYASRGLFALCDAASFTVPQSVRRIIGAKARDDARDALAALQAGQNVLALASGDALYNGFGGTVASLLHGGADALGEELDDLAARVHFHPSVTAFQTLFHKLGLPWQKAELFSAHYSDALPLRRYAAAPVAVIYGGSRHTAQGIARDLCKFLPAMGARSAVLAELLGTPEERIVRGTVQSIADEKRDAPCSPTSILILCDGSAVAHEGAGVDMGAGASAAECAPVLALGLPEDAYIRENNLITASDVRAIVLARLRLPAQGVLWDLGAGSGSVGIEAAALCPNLAVHSVERKAERLDMIAQNCRALGVDNVHVHQGEILECMANLPCPDRIFIGGAGKEMPQILDACMVKLQRGGHIIVSAVTLEALQLLYAWRPECRKDMTSIAIAKEQPMARNFHSLKAQNTIYLFTFGADVR